MARDRLYRIYAEAKRRKLFGILVLYVFGAWVVLQVAATLFPGWRIPQEAIRYVWFGAVALFPVACVFGWFYDLTAGGIRRTSPARNALENLPLARPDYALLSAMTILVVLVATISVLRITALRDLPEVVPNAREILPNSVAVLPFVNLGDERSDEYFSDGITEQLLNELSRIPGLRVAARTSSFYFKDRNELMHVMGRQLGVRTLLEGSIRRSGDMVRITANLFNASDGFNLWSDTFDRKLDDIFAVQDEIADAIAGALRIELLGSGQGGVGRVMTDNVEAFDLFLRAADIRRNASPASLDESIELLHEAIRLDDGFAEAHDALAYGYLLKSYNGSMSTDEAVAMAEPLLIRALSIRPDLEQAHASLGLLKSRLKRYDEANEHYARALELNPNYFGGQLNYGFTLVQQGRLRGGSEAYLRAQALDPLNASLNFNLGALMMLMGEVDSGLHYMRRALDIDPGLSIVRSAITHWLGVYGRLVESVREGERTLAVDGDNLWNARALAQSYSLLGMVDEAATLVDEFRGRFPDSDVLAEARYALLLATGDQATFAAESSEAYRLVDAKTGDPLGVGDRTRVVRYALAAILRGDYALAAENFLWAAGGEAGIATKTYDDMRVLKMLALSYRGLDRVAESDRLLDLCLSLAEDASEHGWDTPNLSYRVAEIHAIRGDADQAIRHLEQAVEKGWRAVADLEHGVAWRGLERHPGLEPVKVSILEDVERQRAILAAERSGRP